MSTQQIFIGRDADGNPLILEGEAILVDNDDELALLPRTTSGWQWTVRFLDRNEIDQTQLSPEEQQILVGGTLFDDTTYVSEQVPVEEGIPEPINGAEADAELLSENLGVELLADASGAFAEGLFLYEVSVGNNTIITGRLRRRRPI
ncbi:MAG TPA: hypothetical protein VFZ34_16725 [Blastocatellia bacterium]|nr:hypothetical protein [Blastocatellia bacterium]